MKKHSLSIIALLIAVAMLIPLASCGQSTSDGTTGATTAATTESTTATTDGSQTVTTGGQTVATTGASTQATTEATQATDEPYIPPVVKTDPILYLSFEAIEGGKIKDQSGNGYDATVTGSPVIEAGIEGNGIRFAKEGQHLEVADIDELNLSQYDDFTLDVWFKWSGTTQGGNWPCIVQKGLVTDAGAYNYIGFWISTSTKELNLGTTSATGNSCNNIPAAATLGTDWHHAVAVQNTSMGTLTYYLDGKYVSRTGCIDATSIGYPITIGYNGKDGQFIGTVDELKIYDFAIDESGFEGAPKTVDSMSYMVYNYTSPIYNKTIGLKYRVYYPSGYSAANSDKFPILMYLHGYGEIGDDNTKQIRILGGSNDLVERLIAEDCCVIIAPQCSDPADYNWVNLNHAWGTGSRDALPQNPTITLEAATELLKSYIAKDKIDEDRVYISGVSMGGYGTWEMITRNPGLFAAAVPLCGSGFPSLASSLKDIAIWAFHGTADPTVPCSGTQDMINAIVEAGGTKAQATYLAGIGHDCWSQAYGEINLVSWLLSQKRVRKTDSTTTFDADNIVFSFAAISDIHQNGSASSIYAAKFATALRQLIARAKLDDKDGLDAIAAVGDLTDNGTTDQITQFKTTLESVIPAGEIPFLYVGGNHDGINYCLHSDANVALFRKTFGEKYFENDVETDPEMTKYGNRHCVVNGYHFLFIEVEEYPNGEQYSENIGVQYTDATKQWLAKTLAEIVEENPNQYIFICTHAMIKDTCYGSTTQHDSTLGGYWYTMELTDILAKYPQVITFGGHLHFPLNDESSIMQYGFTSMGTGSVRYMAIENGGYENMSGTSTMNDKEEFSQGLLLQFDANGNVRITRMDFDNEAEIDEPWVLSHPTASGDNLGKYTSDRRRENAAPSMDGATGTLNTAASGTGVNLTVTFDAGTDDDLIHHYVIEVVNSRGGTIVTKKLMSDYYLHPDKADMSKSLTVNMGKIDKSGTYTVRVIPIDIWDAQGEPLVIEGLIVGDGKEDESDFTLPAAWADIDFKDGEAVDTTGNITITNVGATIGTTDLTCNGVTKTLEALTVAAKGQYAKCELTGLTGNPETFYNNGFSVEAFYINRAPSGSQGIMCGTQDGGWGLATDSGKPYVYVYNKYSQATGIKVPASKGSISELVHVIATVSYDSDANMISVVLYVNGETANTGSVQGSFRTSSSKKAVKAFCLGADIDKDGNGTDFPMTDFSIVDAKIYNVTLNDAQVREAYNNAISLFK
ncbi:MAG: metallophosphoesterase [Clostridia bacterium]|nr:metallophosphoesterase [Clostridia bacterium]